TEMCFSSAEGAADRSVTVANRMAEMWLVKVRWRAGRPCPAGRARRPSLHHPLLLQRINREPAQQLGVEIGGLLGQHFSGKGDIANLFHAYRIHQERYLGLSVAHLQQ